MNNLSKVEFIVATRIDNQERAINALLTSAPTACHLGVLAVA